MLRHGSIRLLLRRGRICLLLGLRRGLGNVLCRRLRLRRGLGNVLCRRLRLRRGLRRLDGRGRGRSKTAHRPALGAHRTRCGIFYGGDCSALVTLEFLHEKILLNILPARRDSVCGNDFNDKRKCRLRADPLLPRTKTSIKYMSA